MFGIIYGERGDGGGVKIEKGRSVSGGSKLAIERPPCYAYTQDLRALKSRRSESHGRKRGGHTHARNNDNEQYSITPRENLNSLLQESTEPTWNKQQKTKIYADLLVKRFVPLFVQWPLIYNL